MPVIIGGKEQPDYRPFSSKVKRTLGLGGSRKDVNLPLETSTRRVATDTPEDLGRKIGKGARQARELLSKYRSPSKR